MKKINYRYAALKALLRFKLFGKTTPLAVRWQLLDRCNNRCQYCNLWVEPRTEMTLSEIKQVLDEMSKAGTIRISYSGGEPLLRDDIDEIIQYTRKVGISPSMNSRGTLIDKRKKAVQNLDLIKISVDGSEKTHDLMSGRAGAYKQVIYAIEKCIEWGTKTVITTTLTKDNIQEIEHILELAEKYKIFASFQPFKLMYKGVKEDRGLYPDLDIYIKEIKKLIDLKKTGFKYLRNTVTSLNDILDYPEFPKMKCAAAKFFSVLDVDGKLIGCDRNDGCDQGGSNDVRTGYAKCFYALSEPECSGCGFLGGRELTYFMNLKLGGISSVKKLLK